MCVHVRAFACACVRVLRVSVLACVCCMCTDVPRRGASLHRHRAAQARAGRSGGRPAQCGPPRCWGTWRWWARRHTRRVPRRGPGPVAAPSLPCGTRGRSARSSLGTARRVPRGGSLAAWGVGRMAVGLLCVRLRGGGCWATCIVTVSLFGGAWGYATLHHPPHQGVTSTQAECVWLGSSLTGGCAVSA